MRGRYRQRSGLVEGDEISEVRPLGTGVVGQILILAAGAVLVIVGLLALGRAGVSGDMSIPVVSVFGFTHTAWLGIIEIVVGVLLLLGGVSQTTRDLGVVMGVLLVVAGILVLAQPTLAPRKLAIERPYGWLLVLTGAAALVGGLMPGGRVRRYRRVARRRYDSGETPTAV